ncbi:unnamed protein product [Schistosoma mansoni]|uniref:Smp_202770 n=1 Tax=Schistosoma mansoni TaxID=6183 RepID=G4LWL0_SCHMA|nr:unnamed protein product [Schistosoma mansoni]|eukprot:XP_018645650.1 unnamed protein product [Schistosoma mansoni]
MCITNETVNVFVVGSKSSRCTTVDVSCLRNIVKDNCTSRCRYSDYCQNVAIHNVK